MLERHLEAPSPGKAVGFIAASLFGMAAHLMFLIALGALGVWALFAGQNAREQKGESEEDGLGHLYRGTAVVRPGTARSG